MATVDLKTFHMNVINTPDTRWQYPEMFTVGKDIYTLFGGYTPNNEVYWIHVLTWQMTPMCCFVHRTMHLSWMAELRIGPKWSWLRGEAQARSLPTLLDPTKVIENYRICYLTTNISKLNIFQEDKNLFSSFGTETSPGTTLSFRWRSYNCGDLWKLYNWSLRRNVPSI